MNSQNKRSNLCRSCRFCVGRFKVEVRVSALGHQEESRNSYRIQPSKKNIIFVRVADYD